MLATEIARRIYELRFSVFKGDTFSEINVDGQCLHLIQYKNFQYRIDQYTISEIDRLNGYTWKGALVFHATAMRFAEPKYVQWSNWSALKDQRLPFAEVEGKWRIDDYPGYYYCGFGNTKPTPQTIEEFLRKDA
jgi:hypothetical protein